MKTLINPVIAHAKELLGDQAMMQAFDENMRQEKEDAGKPKKMSTHEKDKVRDTAAVKRLHDQLVHKALAGSTYVEWMRLGEVVSDIAPKRGKRDAGTEEGDAQWVGQPGDFDAIYNMIIQPELRAEKDSRVVEYVDLKIRRETDNASRSKLAFEIDKFNQVRRPQLLWDRNRELAAIGLRNRAASEMFGLIKANPAHPDMRNWMAELQKLIAPPPPGGVPSAVTLPSAEAGTAPE